MVSLHTYILLSMAASSRPFLEEPLTMNIPLAQAPPLGLCNAVLLVCIQWPWWPLPKDRKGLVHLCPPQDGARSELSKWHGLLAALGHVRRAVNLWESI